jgi:hypothetical protein
MYRHKSVQKANRMRTAYEWYDPAESARAAKSGGA